MSIRSNVDARRLNQRITIQRRTITQNQSNGNLTTTWTNLIVCWAAVDNKLIIEKLKEPVLADQVQEIQDFAIWVRADIIERFSVIAEDRIYWKSKYYDILDILDQQLMGRLTPLLCRKGATSG